MTHYNKMLYARLDAVLDPCPHPLYIAGKLGSTRTVSVFMPNGVQFCFLSNVCIDILCRCISLPVPTTTEQISFSCASTSMG